VICSTLTARPWLAALAGAAVLALLACVDVVGLGGLKAAGLTGKPPPNAELIKSLIGTMTSNWLWLVATGVGLVLVLVLVAGMLAFGSQRAPDVLFRVVAGIGLILVVIPTALA
jgi:hypothetical protein